MPVGAGRRRLSAACVPDPGATGGIDLDSELITELATECPNVVGVKLTYVAAATQCMPWATDAAAARRCGNVGKLTRICATVAEPSFAAQHPRQDPDGAFLVLGGFSDFLLPSVYVRAHGCITGLANVSPVRAPTPITRRCRH